MSTIVVTEFVSLDGVMEDPGGAEGYRHGGWTFKLDRGAEGNKFKVEELFEADALLLGRVTYQAFAKAWPSIKDPDFADRMNSIRKYVFSSTLERADWNNSTIIRGDVVSEARKLKEHARNDLALWGHGLLGETLLKHGLLDEMRLSVFPLFVGKGKLLFRGGENTRLRLIDATSLPNGVVVTRYQPMH